MGRGYPPPQWDPEKIGLSFEIVNFYAFWTLVQEDSTTTVTMILHHSLYFRRRKNMAQAVGGP